MSDIGKIAPRYGVRFVSFLLMAGGILGILASVQMTDHFAQEHRPYRVLIAVLSVPVFSWCIVKGVDLWRGKPSGYWWAKLMFALQIPAVCFSRLTYEF